MTVRRWPIGLEGPFDWGKADKYRIRYVGDGWWAAYEPRIGIPFGKYSDWQMAMAAVSWAISQRAVGSAVISNEPSPTRGRTTQGESP